MAIVSLSLGSNLGDRLQHLRHAVAWLEKECGLTAVSPVYATAPMYVEDQPAFLNAAALCEVDQGPLPFLNRLKDMERKLGRKGGSRYGPREVDIDMISYGVIEYTYCASGEDLLILPHPRVAERRFVLQPLADIAPKLLLPGLGTVELLLESTERQAPSVQKLSDALLPVLSH